MSNKRHKGDAKTFEELSFSEKAKSINGQIRSLENAINHHISHSPKIDTQQICLEQIKRLYDRLSKKKERQLGILKNKAIYKIKDDFKITDEEFLSS